MAQIALKFQSEEDYSPHSFIMSSCNEEAFKWIKSWPDWPSSHCVIIYGPVSCGKSHLSSIWKKITSASSQDGKCVLIEDIDSSDLDEEKLFHLYNHLKENSGYLFLTSKLHPAKLDLKLPDLRSRLKSCPAIAINPPDEVILGMILRKLFADKQLKINKEILDYVLIRIDRSFASAKEFVEKIDSCSLEQKRNITIPLAREVLENL